ncbi:MCE family protein [candidate division WOR-3 bacterium]|nr:MCE family protein [candidate division WOR-3 bacterium]
MKKHLKILYIVLAIAIVAVSVMQIIRLTGRCYYRAIFTETPRLEIGDKVTMHGITIGAVSNIELYEDSVISIFWVKNVELKEGTRLILEPLNIFEDMELMLYPGKGNILPHGATIPGTSKKGLGKTIISIGIFVEHLDSLAYKMMHLTSDAQQSFNETAKGLEQMIANVEKELLKTLESARKIASSTHGMLDKSTTDLTTTIENLRDISARLKFMVETTDTSFTTSMYAFSKITSRLDTLVSFLLAGKGTAGKLLTTESLYTRIDSTLGSLQELIEDIKKNPKRYFSVF